MTYINPFVQLMMFLEGARLEHGSDPAPFVDAAQEYVARLEERDDWLSCLEWAGVDNWQGYSHAYEMQREYFPERVED